MDQEEQRRMAELGTHTEDFRNFLQVSILHFKQQNSKHFDPNFFLLP